MSYKVIKVKGEAPQLKYSSGYQSLRRVSVQYKRIARPDAFIQLAVIGWRSFLFISTPAS